jgi:hypothetical protein
MRINVKSSEHLASKFLKEIASATSREELDVIDKAMDKHCRHNTLHMGTWYVVYLSWSQRYFSL